MSPLEARVGQTSGFDAGGILIRKVDPVGKGSPILDMEPNHDRTSCARISLDRPVFAVHGSERITQRLAAAVDLCRVVEPNMKRRPRRKSGRSRIEYEHKAAPRVVRCRFASRRSLDCALARCIYGKALHAGQRWPFLYCIGSRAGRHAVQARTPGKHSRRNDTDRGHDDRDRGNHEYERHEHREDDQPVPQRLDRSSKVRGGRPSESRRMTSAWYARRAGRIGHSSTPIGSGYQPEARSAQRCCG
jgi:hypothetical protein